ncbi:hypothetical protein [Streptococcus pluranimalium]|uniref:Uncharacterized protein n=1 Tax=Streptococcus pluranimalium TaxID=82348 RepID=A0A345VHI3_9STRE|nr:hypothetical protein [Streptococcus pluranimalium]AXJ12185.1 hypothetical protein Sp14A_02310 [Streptococcus pluranimalium]
MIKEHLFEIIMFFLGLFPSLIVFLYKKYIEKSKLFTFQNMITKEYINPLKVSLERMDGDQRNNTVDLINRTVHRLSFLLENELPYLNNVNQFEYIRTVNYVLEHCKRIKESLLKYSYHSMSSEGEEYDEELEKNRNQALLEIKHLENNLKNYALMKIDI